MLTTIEEAALLDYEDWNSRRDAIRREIDAKKRALEEADANAEVAWELIKHLVTCSCGGDWPCQESVWPGMDTRFHRHVLPKAN
jgi:hypothetical protein